MTKKQATDSLKSELNESKKKVSTAGKWFQKIEEVPGTV